MAAGSAGDYLAFADVAAPRMRGSVTDACWSLSHQSCEQQRERIMAAPTAKMRPTTTGTWYRDCIGSQTHTAREMAMRT